MALKALDILQPVLLRVCLAFVGLTPLLRSRMEVSSPPTSFDHISDTAFLLTSGTDPSLLPYFPAILLPFHKITGAGILPAVFLGAIADAISGGALYQLALALDVSAAEAVDVATMFLWNPLTIASCVSGSADPLRLSAVFSASALAASAAAAGDKKSRFAAGACLALAFQISSSSQILLLAIPLIMLSMKTHQKQQKIVKTPSLMQSTGVYFSAGFLFATTILTLASNYLFSSNIFTFSTRQNSKGLIGHVSGNPWSNIEPNLGLQWYLFAQVLPPFRVLYEYVFWALPTALCISIAVRFGRENPLAVLVGQGIVLCMLSRHPTYADIMLWLGVLPLLLLVSQQKQGRMKKESGDQGIRKYNKVWLGIGFCICLGLNTAAYELWLTLGTGNANFFYGMNLLWAAWQAIALVQLLKSTAAQEEANSP